MDKIHTLQRTATGVTGSTVTLPTKGREEGKKNKKGRKQKELGWGQRRKAPQPVSHSLYLLGGGEKKTRNKTVNRHTQHKTGTVEKLSSHSCPFGHNSQTINICERTSENLG